MAKPSLELIGAIRRTINKLNNGAPYQWGHMGSCNCGSLAQELTPYTKGEIHAFAMQKSGDWSTQIEEYCPTSGYPMDLLIEGLLATGLCQQDLINLEWLSDKLILRKMGVIQLNRNSKEDLVAYLQTWVELLEDELVKEIDIEGIKRHNHPEEVLSEQVLMQTPQ